MKHRPLPRVLEPLMQKPHWVIWKWVLNDTGRWTKPPFQALHPSRYASTTGRETWAKYSEAVKAAPSESDGGIGFVIKGSGIGAIDIDDCVNDPGEINDAAQELIEKSGSYTEITPSRRGVRIIGLTNGPTIKQEHIQLGLGSHAEVYRDCHRFITITGLATKNYSSLKNIDGLIEELVARKRKLAGLNGHKTKEKVDTSPSGLFHSQVLRWAERRWSVERMVHELRTNARRYEHTSAGRYEEQNRLMEEVVRSLENAGVTPKREGEGNGLQILNDRELIAGYTPPDYLIEGLLQRGFLYSLTGRTGSGKTSIMLLIAALVAGFKGYGKQEITLDDKVIERGRVVFFAGENPDDIRMRWMAMSEHMGFEPGELDIHFVLGRVSLNHDMDRIREKVREIGGAQLIIVDTAVAYFEGDDENSNAQMSVYAREMLRPLTSLLGQPCVVVNCHPAKNVADDNLQPRGGGSFVTEMDTNLVATRQGNFCELHWQTKIRGPEFNPIKFEFTTCAPRCLRDSKGRSIKTVVAKALTDEKYEQRTRRLRDREDQVLKIMVEHPRTSMANIALKLGWKDRNGRPDKSTIQKAFGQLHKDKLIRKVRGVWVPTKSAKKSEKKAEIRTDRNE